MIFKLDETKTVALVLGTILALSVFSNFQTSAKLERVCTKVAQLKEGYQDYNEEVVVWFSPHNFDTPFVKRPIDRLGDQLEAELRLHLAMQKNTSLAGDAYRWWVATESEIERNCSG